MSYQHVLSDSGIIHAIPDDSDWSVCGKTVSTFSEETDAPVTCKVCKRSIELSRSFRLARRLSALAIDLYADMQARPGAYIHADRNSIELMKLAIESD